LPLSLEHWRRKTAGTARPAQSLDGMTRLA
jgi:hypothetical protein